MIFSYLSVTNCRIVLRCHRWDFTFRRLSQEPLKLYRGLGKSSVFNRVSSDISREKHLIFWKEERSSENKILKFSILRDQERPSANTVLEFSVLRVQEASSRLYKNGTLSSYIPLVFHLSILPQ